ncbi:arp2/3 complex-activating protein rickA-like [Cloeon dipterum]|uniref:arp2/3 complex-activating protein rickA-like n=1 Tax=Cloeon dipterum TaxID=197152 RepID=UPI0032206729
MFKKLFLVDETSLELIKRRKEPKLIDYETLYDALMTEEPQPSPPPPPPPPSVGPETLPPHPPEPRAKTLELISKPHPPEPRVKTSELISKPHPPEPRVKTPELISKPSPESTRTEPRWKPRPQPQRSERPVTRRQTQQKIKSDIIKKIDKLPIGLRDRAKKLFKTIQNSGKIDMKDSGVFFNKKRIGDDLFSLILNYINPEDSLQIDDKPFKSALRDISSKKWNKLDF